MRKSSKTAPSGQRRPPTETEAGFAFASYFLCVSILADQLHRGDLTAEQLSAVFARARMIAESPKFPGPAKALAFARHLLGQSETMVVAAAAEMPPSGPH